MDTRQNLPNQMYITLLISLHLTGLTFKFYSLESRLHFYQLLKKNLTYFTTIDIQVLQLLSLSLIGLDVSARESLVWEEVGVPGENPCVQGTTID